MGYTRTQVEASFPGGVWKTPVKYWVKSPLRPEERTASFEIDIEKGAFYDHGTGQGGKLSELFALTGQEDPYQRSDAAVSIPHSQEAESAVIQRQKAREIWETATEGKGHPYLSRKGVEAHGARRMPTVTIWKDDEARLKTRSADVLVVPSYAPDGSLIGIEQIEANGKKWACGSKGFFILGAIDPEKPVIVCEGYATAASVKAISNWNTVCAFGHANLEKAANAVQKLTQEIVAIAPDAQSADLSGDFDVVTFPGGYEKNTDWNDLCAKHGPEIVKQMFRDQWTNRRKVEKPAEKPSTAFTLRRIGDIPLTEPEFLVDDLLETDTLALFFGESGCRKTFAVFDIAASIATGAPYAGRQTKEGTVIYLCGEGNGGLPRRAKAWEMHRGISLKDAPLYTSSRAALLMDEHGAKDVESKVDQIAAESGAPSLIVIDTVARSMVGGDENSAKDTGIFIERVDALRRKYGASCILVHHSGIADKGRLRGSSAWKGALDAEFLVSLDGDIVTLTATKMKEAEQPAPISFRSHEYTVMIGKTGKEITSLALEPTDERPARVKELSPGLKRALDSYHEAAKEKPELDAEGKFIGVHVESWRPYFYEKATADSPDGKRQAFNRSIKKLVEERHLSVKNDVYTPVGEVDTVLVNRYAQRINHSSQRDTVTYRDMTVTCHAADDLERDKRDIILKDVTLSRSSVTVEEEKSPQGEEINSRKNELGKDSSLVEKESARQEFLRLYDSGVEMDMATGRPMSEIVSSIGTNVNGLHAPEITREIPSLPCGEPSLSWLESQPESTRALYASKLAALQKFNIPDAEKLALQRTFEEVASA